MPSSRAAEHPDDPEMTVTGTLDNTDVDDIMHAQHIHTWQEVATSLDSLTNSQARRFLNTIVRHPRIQKLAFVHDMLTAHLADIAAGNIDPEETRTDMITAESNCFQYRYLPTNIASHMRILASAEARAQHTEALQAIHGAMEACDYTVIEISQAAVLLEHDYSAHTAARCSRLIQGVLETSSEVRDQVSNKFRAILRHADRFIRDVIVMTIKSQMTDPTSRPEFLQKILEACGDMEPEPWLVLRAQLLLAVDKSAVHKMCGWKSNNAVATERRGHPRPRRRARSMSPQRTQDRTTSPERRQEQAQTVAFLAEPMYINAISMPIRISRLELSDT
jgi:hypothetical protein